MTTATEVIRALTFPEDPFNCIASIASTRCTVVIQLDKLERFEIIKSLVLTNNLKLLRQRLDEVIRLVLCDTHRKEDVVQEYIRRWSQDESVEGTGESSSSEASRFHGSEDGDSSDEANSPPATAGPSVPVRIQKRRGRPSFQSELFRGPADQNSICASDNNTTQDTVVQPARKAPGSAPERASRPVNATYDRRSPVRFGDGHGYASQLLAPPYIARKRAVSDPNATAPQDPKSKRPKTLEKTVASAPILRSRRTVSLQQSGTPTRVRPTNGPQRMPGHLSDDREQEASAIYRNYAFPDRRRSTSASATDTSLEPSAESDDEATTPTTTVDTSGDLNPCDTSGPKKEHDARTIEDGIRYKIREPLVPNPKKRDKKGYVYIFKDPKRPGFLKIGRTEQVISSRRSQLENLCNIRLQTVYNEQLPFLNCQRAEGLVHAELAHCRQEGKCSGSKCDTKHREWFEVSEEIAKEVVGRWVDFIRKSPYENNGELKEFWKERLDYMDQPKKQEKLEDYVKRRNRWKFVISAKWWHFRIHAARYYLTGKPGPSRARENVLREMMKCWLYVYSASLSLILVIVSWPWEPAICLFVFSTILLFFAALRG